MRKRVLVNSSEEEAMRERAYIDDRSSLAFEARNSNSTPCHCFKNTALCGFIRAFDRLQPFVVPLKIEKTSHLYVWLVKVLLPANIPAKIGINTWTNSVEPLKQCRFNLKHVSFETCLSMFRNIKNA